MRRNPNVEWLGLRRALPSTPPSPPLFWLQSPVCATYWDPCHWARAHNPPHHPQPPTATTQERTGVEYGAVLVPQPLHAVEALHHGARLEAGAVVATHHLGCVCVGGRRVCVYVFVL